MPFDDTTISGIWTGLGIPNASLVYTIGLLIISSYLVLVRAIRYDRAGSFARSFEMDSPDSFSKTTTDQAQSVLKNLTQLEFPKFMGFSIIFALFKVSSLASVVGLYPDSHLSDIWHSIRVFSSRGSWAASRY
jgi:hypothetical protein